MLVTYEDCMTKSKDIPKKANRAIDLLEGLIEQLHYFYNGNDLSFKKHVLKDALEIEDILKDISITKKETFKRVAKKYEDYYKKKQEAIENTVINVTDTKLNNSLRERYRHDFKDDTNGE